ALRRQRGGAASALHAAPRGARRARRAASAVPLRRGAARRVAGPGGQRHRRRRDRDLHLRRRRLHHRGARRAGDAGARALRGRAMKPMWLVTAPPERLAVVRWLTGLFALTYLLARAGHLARAARFPPERFDPVGLVSLL